MSSVVSLKYLNVEFLRVAYWESTLKLSVFLLYFVHKFFFLIYTVDRQTDINARAHTLHW